MANFTFDHDVAAHNQAIADRELSLWNSKPDHMLAYYTFPSESDRGLWYRQAFYPFTNDARVTLWLGKEIGYIVAARVYRHNFGARMVSLKVRGTNGCMYYGRASWDGGNCINLRKFK